MTVSRKIFSLISCTKDWENAMEELWNARIENLPKNINLSWPAQQKEIATKSHWLWKSCIPMQILCIKQYILSLCMWLGCQKITLLCFVFLEGDCWKPFSSVKMHFDGYFSTPLSSLGPLHFCLGSGKFPLFSLSWILIFLWHFACWRILGSWEKKLLGGLRFRIYIWYFPNTCYWLGALTLS